MRHRLYDTTTTRDVNGYPYNEQADAKKVRQMRLTWGEAPVTSWGNGGGSMFRSVVVTIGLGGGTLVGCGNEKALGSGMTAEVASGYASLSYRKTFTKSCAEARDESSAIRAEACYPTGVTVSVEPIAIYTEESAVDFGACLNGALKVYYAGSATPIFDGTMNTAQESMDDGYFTASASSLDPCFAFTAYIEVGDGGAFTSSSYWWDKGVYRDDEDGIEMAEGGYLQTAQVSLEPPTGVIEEALGIPGVEIDLNLGAFVTLPSSSSPNHWVTAPVLTSEETDVSAPTIHYGAD